MSYAWAALGVGLFGLSMASSFPLVMSLLSSAGEGVECVGVLMRGFGSAEGFSNRSKRSTLGIVGIRLVRPNSLSIMVLIDGRSGT